MFRLIAVLAVLVTSNVAAAQSAPNRACSTRGELLNRLSHAYSEVPIALGMASNGGVLEVLSSGSGSSWTIIITMPDGQSCLFASGESWQTLPRSRGSATNPPA